MQLKFLELQYFKLRVNYEYVPLYLFKSKLIFCGRHSASFKPKESN